MSRRGEYWGSEDFGQKFSFITSFVLLTGLNLGVAFPTSCQSYFRMCPYNNNDLYRFGFVSVFSPNHTFNMRITYQSAKEVQGRGAYVELSWSQTQVHVLQYKVYLPFWQNCPPKVTKMKIDDVQICEDPISVWNAPCTIQFTEYVIVTRLPPQEIPGPNNAFSPTVTQPPPDNTYFANTPTTYFIATTPSNLENVHKENTKQVSLDLSNPNNGDLRPMYPTSEANGSNNNYDDSDKSNNSKKKRSGTRASVNLDPIWEDPETTDYQYSDVCGTFLDINPLIYNGKTVTQRSEFPWLVAIFRKTVLGLKFICGGSLVSKKHVVTAAHCVNQNGKTVSSEELVLLLGRKNLQSWANDGAVFVEPERIIIHPEYNKTSADADIALLVFPQEISFTDNVKPVCLWTGNSSLQDVVNRMGVVVGWGRDENGVLSLLPKQLTLPVVDQATCLWSHRAFRDLTSERTFCAGYRDNSGPCDGDSGGGFVMKIDDKWLLRGVISTSLSNSGRRCDLTQYVIFTDASKFTDWFLSYLA